MKDVDFFGGLALDLVPLARAHRETCHSRGLNLVFISGRRTWLQQMDAFKVGRSRTAAGWVVTDHRIIVTNALPDQSPHCRGGAYDCAALDQHERIDWNRLDLFQAVAELAPKALVWGGSFPFHDLDHFELRDWRALPQPT